jgi:hypothetical protein
VSGGNTRRENTTGANLRDDWIDGANAIAAQSHLVEFDQPHFFEKGTTMSRTASTNFNNN